LVVHLLQEQVCPKIPRFDRLRHRLRGALVYCSLSLSKPRIFEGGLSHPNPGEDCFVPRNNTKESLRHKSSCSVQQSRPSSPLPPKRG
jgi:hypothetical protein